MISTAYRSPNYNARTHPIDMIIIHYTDMETATAALERLCDSAAEVSAHYVIEQNGTIHQIVDDEHRAWHAGVSSWEGATNINCRSIGIELDYYPPRDRDFHSKQIDALIQLITILCARYSIPHQRILGHEDVAPGRKSDPGPHFPWKILAAAGFGRFYR